MAQVPRGTKTIKKGSVGGKLGQKGAGRAMYPPWAIANWAGVESMANGAELLLVDVSLAQRAVLQRLLTSHGFAVTGLACLRQAAAILTVRHFDHAVLDLRLPDRHGLDLIRTLRARHPRARIVIVTDADSFATVVLALRAGADGLVPKPVDEGELLDVLFDRALMVPPVPQTPLGLHRTCWEHVMRIYEQCDRNMTQAAKRLGMHRRSLQRFLGKRAPMPRTEV
jgi:two-component system, response regulator RegA